MASSKARKIPGKIVKWQANPVDESQQETDPTLPVRPSVLRGKTYRIYTPLSEHSLYVIINDITLNPGTPDEIRRPFEIFVNTKSTEHFQWIVALTRVTSAIFRRGGDLWFLVSEFKSVHDPKGGRLTKDGYVPSLVAEIGIVLEKHFKEIGLKPGKGI
jgi:hypothetical protein